MWCRISHLTGCLGQPKQLLVKIKSVPAELRTDSKEKIFRIQWFFTYLKTDLNSRNLGNMDCIHSVLRTVYPRPKNKFPDSYLLGLL